MMTSQQRTKVGIVAALLAASAALSAVERKPLPPFLVSATDGRTIAASELARPERWVLIYVRPDCRSCDAVLRSIKRDEHPLVPSRLVIIVGGAADVAAAASAKLPDLADAGWYADPAGSVPASLKIAGAPVIIGMDRSTVEWSLEGVLSPSTGVSAIVASWVEASR